MKRLCKIGENFYYRLVIPKDLAIYFPFSREIRRSLRTTNFRSAKQLTGIYNAEADKLFTMIRGNTAMTDKEIKQLVADFTATILDKNEDARLERGHQISDFGNHLEADIPYSDIAETVQRQIIDASFSEVKRIFENYLEEKEVTLDFDRESVEYKKVLKAASQGYLDTLEIDRKRDLLDYSGDPEEKLEAPYLGSEALSSVGPAHAEGQKEKAPEKQYLQCSEVVSKFIDFQKKESNVNSKTLGEKTQVLERFIYIKGDKPINQYTVADFDEYKAILSKLPDRMGNKKEYIGLSVDEVLAMDYTETLAIRTMRKHITIVKNFFQWALEREHVDANKSIALKLPKIPRGKPKPRIPYSREDLEKMIEGYAIEYDESRDFKKRPDWFYIPLIAAYSGMRQNEICQLGIDDLLKCEKSGVWYFNVYEEEGVTQVKNTPSIRKVPVHPVLVGLGLLEYHRQLKKQGQSRLWPLLNKGADNKYSKAIQNWFNGKGGASESAKGFRQRFISEDPRKVFHSFRHTFRNELKQVRADTDIAHEIVGHEYEVGEASTYTEDYELTAKFSELSKVSYNNLDLSSLKEIAESYL